MLSRVDIRRVILYQDRHRAGVVDVVHDLPAVKDVCQRVVYRYSCEQLKLCDAAAVLASLGESDAAAASSVGLAGIKTTKPIPAGLSTLSSQHASDHTMAWGSLACP